MKNPLVLLPTPVAVLAYPGVIRSTPRPPMSLLSRQTTITKSRHRRTVPPNPSLSPFLLPFKPCNQTSRAPLWTPYCTLPLSRTATPAERFGSPITLGLPTPPPPPPPHHGVSHKRSAQPPPPSPRCLRVSQLLPPLCLADRISCLQPQDAPVAHPQLTPPCPSLVIN